MNHVRNFTRLFVITFQSLYLKYSLNLIGLKKSSWMCEYDLILDYSQIFLLKGSIPIWNFLHLIRRKQHRFFQAARLLETSKWEMLNPHQLDSLKEDGMKLSQSYLLKKNTFIEFRYDWYFYLANLFWKFKILIVS